MQATLSQAKDGLIDAQAAVMDKAKAAAKATDGYVHDNPWKSVSVAAGVGLLLGIVGLALDKVLACTESWLLRWRRPGL